MELTGNIKRDVYSFLDREEWRSPVKLIRMIEGEMGRRDLTRRDLIPLEQDGRGFMHENSEVGFYITMSELYRTLKELADEGYALEEDKEVEGYDENSLVEDRRKVFPFYLKTDKPFEPGTRGSVRSFDREGANNVTYFNEVGLERRLN